MNRLASCAVALTAAVVPAALIGPAAGLAQTGTEEAQGAQLLQSVQQGKKTCSDLDASDFELIGEAWMGQMFGSTQAHEAMNRLMASMMGSDGERQMHEYMGRRVSGCGGGSVPSGFGRMMGMMAMMGGAPGGASGSNGGAGMMGGQGGGYYGPGSMMGGNPQPAAGENGNGEDDDGPSVGAMVGMMAVLIGAVAVALAVFRPWRRTGSAQELLDRRFAAGELSAEDYRRAKAHLEGN